MKNLFETEQNPQISIEKLRVIEKLFIPRFLYTNVKVEHTEIMTVVNGQSKDILFSVMKHSFPIKGLNDIGFRLLVEWGGKERDYCRQQKFAGCISATMWAETSNSADI